MEDNIILAAGLEALSAACDGASLKEKAGAFHRMEAAIALERACSAIELLSESATRALWANELSIRWHPSPTYAQHAPIEIVPELGRGFEMDPIHIGAASALNAIMEVSIDAIQLAEGGMNPHAARAAYSRADALKSAMCLSSKGLGFDGRAALALKGSLATVASELGKALVWAAGSPCEWMAAKGLSASWEKQVARAQCDSPESLAAALGFTALVPSLERRAIERSAGAPKAASQRPPSL